MTTLLNIAVLNAVTVIPLAVLAYAVSRLARRPAVTHAVWVLVLLKFVTPPLFNLPVTIEVPVANRTVVESGSNVAIEPPSTATIGASSAEPARAVEPRNAFANDSARRVQNRKSAAVSSTLPIREKQASNPTGATLSGKSSAAWTKTVNVVATEWSRRPGLPSLLLTVWLVGVGLWTMLQIARAIRFQRRVLRGAVESPDLQQQTHRLANKLGLRCVPRVLIVDAPVSPMLWGCGSRAQLLFPMDLADRLNPEACATLLTHELAHFGRGDHWVRLLELVATGLFWWHPVVWWARHQIEESEEECCDAWVVSEFPHAPRQYAEALLDTIDFLCESRQALPPCASGLGQAHLLRLLIMAWPDGARKVPADWDKLIYCGNV